MSSSIPTKQTAREGRLDACTTSGQSPPQAALKYAAAGLAVFPLRDKRPMTGHGSKDASTDPETVAYWWQRWPKANIGLRTGDGLVVIDVDYWPGQPDAKRRSTWVIDRPLDAPR